MSRWKKPQFGWIKLNVDGSCAHISNPRSAGCGGVLRDSSGTWLFGFSQKLDPGLQSHETEIEAILKGLELVWGMNYKKLVVESDNEPVVSMVQDGRGGNNHQQYSRIIRQLLFDPKWEVKVVSILRGANRVAHRLAREARDMPLGTNLRKYSNPQGHCHSLVNEDAGLR